MVDEPSSLGEAVMLGSGSIEHRELIYYTVSKSTTFEPPRAGPRLIFEYSGCDLCCSMQGAVFTTLTLHFTSLHVLCVVWAPWGGDIRAIPYVWERAASAT